MNNEYTKCLDNLNLKVEDELFDFIHSGHDNTADYCLESADSSEDVIYYGKAEKLFNSASSEEREEAESMLFDCGGYESDTMSVRFTKLSFWIVYNRIMEALSTQIEGLLSELDERLEDSKNRRLWGSIIEDMISSLENS